MTQETALHGYAATTIAEITTHAHVSRTTFYEHFKDRQDCFLAAHRMLAEQLVDETAKALDAAPASPAGWRAFLKILIEYTAREPAAFNLLTHEAMTAGPEAIDERDRLLAALEHTWAGVAVGATVPDLPAKLLLGGVIRELGIHMRLGENDPALALTGLLGWAESYAAAADQEQRRDSTYDKLPPPPIDPTPGPPPPAVLPKGRRQPSAQVVARVQRERILHATTQAIQAKSYADIAVADITASAGLSRETFYRYFRDKEEAFLATHQMIFEQLLAASAGAFFTTPSPWPDRVWDGIAAFVGFIVAQPSFAHFACVESYALGPSSARITDERIIAFTLFLADGHHWRPESAEVPEIAAQAIACAVMELSAYYVRHDRSEELYGLLPLLIYTILAPFMGVEAANEFIDGKLRGTPLVQTPRS